MRSYFLRDWDYQVGFLCVRYREELQLLRCRLRKSVVCAYEHVYACLRAFACVCTYAYVSMCVGACVCMCIHACDNEYVRE